MAAVVPPSKAVAHERGRVAGLSRDRKPDDPELVQARHNLRVEMLAQHVQRVIDAAPPLSDEQRTRLAELLRPARQTVVAATLTELDAGGDGNAA